jgi:hypothetical protein
MQFLFDIPSLLVILGAALGCGIAGGFRESAVALVRATVIAFGFVYTTLGFCLALAKMDDPITLLPAAAVAFLTLLYACLTRGLVELLWPQPTTRPDRPAKRTWLGTTVAVGPFLPAVALSNASLSSIVDLSAVLACVLTVLAIIGSGRVQGRMDGMHRVATFAPRAGLFFLWLSLLPILANAGEPRRIGPYLAFGLLSYLYLQVVSIVVTMTAAHRIDLEEVASTQWRELPVHLLGLLLTIGLVIGIVASSG